MVTLGRTAETIRISVYIIGAGAIGTLFVFLLTKDQLSLLVALWAAEVECPAWSAQP